MGAEKKSFVICIDNEDYPATTNDATVEVVSAGTPLTASGAKDWMYDNTTGDLIINTFNVSSQFKVEPLCLIKHLRVKSVFPGVLITLWSTSFSFQNFFPRFLSLFVHQIGRKLSVKV